MLAELIERLVLYPTNLESFSEDQARGIITDIGELFRVHLIQRGIDERTIRRMTTKFRDAGRRSPPWMEGSERGARRPQDGADGNRRNRWLFDPSHPFYADEITATLVEVKFYLQTLSMEGAPALPNDKLRTRFRWLLGHELEPGAFLDPVQKAPVLFREFCRDARYVEAGHVIPHSRGGRHEPSNSTLMLKSSNRLQGDRTIPELISMMKEILERNGFSVTKMTEESK